MQDFIEEHLGEPITLHRLAEAAGYSPWHCGRIFRELTGKTPFDYIRALRLSKAALVLRDGEARVTDVAFDFVFDSHEGFTKAFSRQFGLPPDRYRHEAPAIPLFLPYRVCASSGTGSDEHVKKERDRKMLTKDNAVFVQVVERPARKILLKRGIRADEYFAYCEEVGCDVWGVLSSVREALYEPIGMWLPDHMIPPGTSKYVQGVELPLDYSKPVPEGYELIETPACRMMIFQGPPYDEEVFEDAILDMWKLLESFDPKIYGYVFAPEEAPRFQLAPMGYRGYIEGRPVRPLSRT